MIAEKPIDYVILNEYIELFLSKLDKNIEVCKYRDVPYTTIYRVLVRKDKVGHNYITIQGKIEHEYTPEFGNIIITFGNGDNTYKWERCGVINIIDPQFESKFIDILNHAVALLLDG